MWIKPGVLDLTYCTNIHAGETWCEVRASLEEYAVPLKARLSPDAPFGLGLRLSAIAAAELVQPQVLQGFKRFLSAHDLYVAVINGFPFGSFHAEVVKTDVFAPDWRDPLRLAYTLNLARILSELLPEGVSGGISTLPLSYKPWIDDAMAATVFPTLCAKLAEFAGEMVRLRQSTGRFIHLDIEPEPNGLIENTEELIAFFRGPLLQFGAPALAERLAVSLPNAEHLIREHIQVCFDVCHIAIQFEDPVHSLERLRAEGIGIGRLQISSALRMPLNRATTRAEMEQRLAPFADRIYLHQVVQRSEGGKVERFIDLSDALASDWQGITGEWRIHFHVPLFTEQLGGLLSTQQENAGVLGYATERIVTTHLEVETYTWHVLPEQLKVDLRSSIERELRWVLEQMPAHELCTKP